MSALRDEGVETERDLVNHQIEPGVVSEAVVEGDEWPAIRERILAAEILVVATPTCSGSPRASPSARSSEWTPFCRRPTATTRPRSRSIASPASWSSATRTVPITSSRRSAAR